MRIIAGRWRGVPLTPVGRGDMGAHLRPTPDRVRESLFSMLAHKGVLDGAHVLDLFAGTGALAFEALSRGAASAVLVENGRVGQRLITQNIAKLGADTAQLRKVDATRPGVWNGTPFDLVFLDPPYDKGLGVRALAAVTGWLAPGAVISWEEARPQDAPPGYRLDGHRRFGAAHLTLLERAG